GGSALPPRRQAGGAGSVQLPAARPRRSPVLLRARVAPAARAVSCPLGWATSCTGAASLLVRSRRLPSASTDSPSVPTTPPTASAGVPSRPRTATWLLRAET